MPRINLVRPRNILLLEVRKHRKQVRMFALTIALTIALIATYIVAIRWEERRQAEFIRFVAADFHGSEIVAVDVYRFSGKMAVVVGPDGHRISVPAGLTCLRGDVIGQEAKVVPAVASHEGWGLNCK